MPFLYKDGIKETLFDTLGWSDREWSRRLGVATYGCSFTCWRWSWRQGARSWSRATLTPNAPDHPSSRCANATASIQYRSAASRMGAVLLERFRSRAATNERHPGHVETPNMAEFEPVLLRGRLDPLPLDGLMIEVDTTDLAKVDIEAIMREVSQSLADER